MNFKNGSWSCSSWNERKSKAIFFLKYTFFKFQISTKRLQNVRRTVCILSIIRSLMLKHKNVFHSRIVPHKNNLVTKVIYGKKLFKYLLHAAATFDNHCTSHMAPIVNIHVCVSSFTFHISQPFDWHRNRG